MNSTNDELLKPQTERPPRKPYARPKLVTHGTLQDLTAGPVGYKQGDRFTGGPPS